MTRRQLKAGCFTLTALNTLSTTYFLDFLFFFLRDHFGFGNRQNLWASALHGFIYTIAAWQCGKFAERHGFFTSLKIGFGGLAGLMVIGAFLNSAVSMIALIAAYSVVLLFTWPALEAIVSVGELRAGVQNSVGIYNCTWAGAAAFGYFTGGRLYDWSQRGAVFWIPAGMFALQLALAVWLSRQSSAVPPDREAGRETEPTDLNHGITPPTAISPKTFMKMAWLANPFAFVAVNTVWAVMPGIAGKLNLSATQVGVFGSVWLFGRLGAFVCCWQWSGWHYRFGWLLGSFAVLIVSFMAMLLAAQLWIVIAAQIFFGFCVGMIYYASLFYSMDVGETKAEHGGLHEAAIGAGIFAGPAVGAASLQFLPRHSATGVFAVSTLMFLGFIGMILMRLKPAGNVSRRTWKRNAR